MVDLIPAHCTEYELDSSSAGDIIVAEAPGRIYFMGEHCIGGGGVSLVSGIDRFVRIAASPRKDSALRFFSAGSGERKRTTTANLRYKREDRWANHVKIALCLFSELGNTIPGFSFTIATDIPRHSGLAYNIAVEVAAAVALRSYFKSNISDRDLITKLAELHLEFYEHENKIVDFLAIMFAKKDTFLAINPGTHTVKKIKSPFSQFQILLLDSKVPWFGIEEDLRERQNVLKRAIATLSERKGGLAISAYPTEELTALIASFDEVIRRCCMHIASEIVRVQETERALKENDEAVLAKIFFASHESLRDLYEISCPELDWLVKRAQEIPGVMAARMTGKGFGGCTYAIMRPEHIAEYNARMDDYERIFGFRPIIYEIRQANGARIV
ncbi:MAG: galactokinase [Spirochaetaceae bacterium]|jgi:galactokinase|nr:galactokinase [Spirochaetaceae bacterium]